MERRAGTHSERCSSPPIGSAGLYGGNYSRERTGPTFETPPEMGSYTVLYIFTVNGAQLTLPSSAKDETGHRREYWMNYRGPGFLAVV